MIRHFVKMTASNTRLIQRRGEEKPLRLGLMAHGLLFIALVSGSAHSARAELISQRLDANVAVRLNGDPTTVTASTSTRGVPIEGLAADGTLGSSLSTLGTGVLHGMGGGTATLTQRLDALNSGTYGLGGQFKFSFETTAADELVIEYANQAINGVGRSEIFLLGLTSGVSELLEIPRNSFGTVNYAINPGSYELTFFAPSFTVLGARQELLQTTVFNWGLGGLPGELPDFPVFPNVPDDDGFVFDVITSDEVRFFDPEYATGYDYVTDGTPFASVLIPNALPGGDDMFELVVGNQTFQLLSGQEFDFTTINSDGVSEFGIRGISVAEQLDPNDPLGFVTGLSFIEAGAVSSFQMTAVTAESVVPEPSALALFGCGTFGMVVLSNRRRKSQGR